MHRQRQLCLQRLVACFTHWGSQTRAPPSKAPRQTQCLAVGPWWAFFSILSFFRFWLIMSMKLLTPYSYYFFFLLLIKALSTVVGWLPHGRSWRILNRDRFTKEVLPQYFDHKNFNSFIRLVNAWGWVLACINNDCRMTLQMPRVFLKSTTLLFFNGLLRFRRVQSGVDCDSYYHEVRIGRLPRVPWKYIFCCCASWILIHQMLLSFCWIWLPWK